MESTTFINELQNRLIQRFGSNIEDVILFGSQINGRATKESDHDVLIILKNNYNYKYKNKLSHYCYEINRKYGIWIDLHVVSKYELKTIKGKEPFILEALKNTKYKMTLKQPERETLIKYRIEVAKETLDDAKFNMDNNKLFVAVNRIYYGMYYMLSALALMHKFKRTKHKPLIDWFIKTFVDENIIDKKFGDIITNTFDKRIEGDYVPYTKFSKKEAEELFEQAKDFNKEIEKLIISNN
ncbi:MAG: HEPN domain-containing protein [Cytophagales bacterium]|nr:HEPN domain-containing protein [Cytophagales bacterium]